MEQNNIQIGYLYIFEMMFVYIGKGLVSVPSVDSEYKYSGIFECSQTIP